VASLFWAANGPMPTTAALSPVTTGTAVKTMLQIASSASRPLKVIEWGISFDGTTVSTPIRVELVETGTVAATVTAFTTGGVQRYDDPNSPDSTVTLGTSASGFTATAEGTVTTSRYADLQLLPPTGPYTKQWPLGREFEVGISRILRVRVTATAAVNAYTYVIWEE
jgi:hypothetical protein